MLHEVVDGVRALTGARYDVITTVDAAGQTRDFVTAAVTPDEDRAMETWPDGLRLFGHLRELAAPLRLPDLDAWIRSLGCSPFPVPYGELPHRRPVALRHPAVQLVGLRRHPRDAARALRDLLQMVVRRALERNPDLFPDSAARRILAPVAVEGPARRAVHVVFHGWELAACEAVGDDDAGG